MIAIIAQGIKYQAKYPVTVNRRKNTQGGYTVGKHIVYSTNPEIKIEMVEGMIIVREPGTIHIQSGGNPAVNQYGKGTGLTLAQEYEEGSLFVWEENERRLHIHPFTQ